MKYLVIEERDLQHLVIFPHHIEHIKMWREILGYHLDATLLSAGALYFTECESYPNEHYIEFEPGSASCKIAVLSKEQHTHHCGLAWKTLPKAFPFILNYRGVLAAPTLTDVLETGKQGSIAIELSPKDHLCPRGRITVTGLTPTEASAFWSGFRRY